MNTFFFPVDDRNAQNNSCWEDFGEQHLQQIADSSMMVDVAWPGTKLLVNSGLPTSCFATPDLGWSWSQTDPGPPRAFSVARTP